MSTPISLKAAEQKVFRAAFNDGLLDIFLGCFFLMFTVAPVLSERMGDFWSSAVFLPFWGLIYLTIRFLRTNVVRPRMGNVAFGPARKSRLVRFNVIMLVVNVLALILGILAARLFLRVPGQFIGLTFGMILLVAFSIGAYFLEVRRLYAYGLLAAGAPLLGEWLYAAHGASHHGFPITFGVVSTVMILVGSSLFLRLLRTYPASTPDLSTGEV